MKEKIKGTDAEIMAFGHVHGPYVREVNGQALVCTAAVGMSWDGDYRPPIRSWSTRAAASGAWKSSAWNTTAKRRRRKTRTAGCLTASESPKWCGPESSGTRPTCRTNRPMPVTVHGDKPRAWEEQVKSFVRKRYAHLAEADAFPEGGADRARGAGYPPGFIEGLPSASRPRIVVAGICWLESIGRV